MNCIKIDRNGEKCLKMNSRKNRNYQRINNLIIEAFIDLCKKESADSISVSMLCKKLILTEQLFIITLKTYGKLLKS